MWGEGWTRIICRSSEGSARYPTHTQEGARREAGPFLYSPERRVAPDVQVIKSTRMTTSRTRTSVETPMVVEPLDIAALLSAWAAAMVVA